MAIPKTVSRRLAAVGLAAAMVMTTLAGCAVVPYPGYPAYQAYPDYGYPVYSAPVVVAPPPVYGFYGGYYGGYYHSHHHWR